MHPENIDPPWFQELIRRAYDRGIRQNLSQGWNMDESWQGAMWYIFELRNNITELYRAGGPNDAP